MHLRVYHFGQNQRWERLGAFFAPKSIGKFWTTSKKEQLSGHKNLKSIENYSKVSTKQQMKLSQVLSSVVASTATKTSSYEKANPAISSSTFESQQSMALFSGAVIQGAIFNQHKHS